ncbi:MAG TPA: methyltransferase domain-containing protein [Steroidobacteraceae bacterium]|nr:methyltransferase domain-containing protein [Steroidobacteraceae bacterium]
MATAHKAYRGLGMEGSVARWYERTTRRDMPEFRALAARIAPQLPKGGAVLEIAPGPGFLAIELARLGLDVLGVDISRTFVELARANAAAAQVPARFELGNASALTVSDACMDGVVCRAAFKNFAEPVEALKEMRRILRPGGIALLVDLRRDASLPEIRRFVDGLGVGWLNRMIMMATFRGMLIKRAYPLEDIRRMMTEAGWQDVRIEVTPIGFEAWMRK